MERDELLRQIIEMSPEAEVKVAIDDGLDLEVIAIRFDADRDSIVIVPHPDDLADAFKRRQG